MQDREYLSSIPEIIEDAKKGKLFILVDDENRENEGDLVIPGEMANAETINFMAKYGRGLICLALTQNRVEELNLPLMSRYNNTRHQTAFTVSIEAKEGVTTGISASDRAQTIKTAIDPKKLEKDIVTPGHVFPLVAREGGVLVRAGHTEAAVDIARIAKLNPSGVICEIMNEDGTMARMPDLIKFSQKHNIKIGTIADLIAYRRKHDKLVELKCESTITSKYGGEFKLYVYINKLEYAEHIVLVKGNPEENEPVLVRMHALNIMSDVFGDTTMAQDSSLHQSMKIIGQKGKGVIVLIREPKKNSVSELITEKHNTKSGKENYLRDYGIGAQILLDLKIKNMILLTNSKRSIIGLEGYGLNINSYKEIV